MRARTVTLGIAAMLCTGAIVAAGAPAQYTIPPGSSPAAAPDPRPRLGESVVISRVRGRVTYRPAGVRRSRVLTAAPVEVRMGARVDATNGRVLVRIARNRSGATSRATFFDGAFRVEGQDRSSPFEVTLGLTGPSFRRVCGERGTSARASAKRRSRKRVRRLWGDGKGRYRTRGRYSAASVRGTKWLTEDRCDGTVTRVERGVVVVEDFTAFEDDPAAKSPQPQSGGGEGVSGGGEDGARPAPVLAPRRPRQVRVRRGGSYTAGPKA